MQFMLHADSPDFWEIVEPQAQLERLADGFQFLEGPAWDVRKNALIYSDIIGNRIYRWREDYGLEVLRQPSNMANGNTFDMQGNLWTCEHAASRVSCMDLDGNYRVVADQYQGKELNSPNDIVVKSDGSVYFSDPSFGRRERVGITRSQQLPFQGVYRLESEHGDLNLLADDFENPNGLCFDLQEKRLFVNDSPRGHIRVFNVNRDGNLSDGRVWAEMHGSGPGVPDGMKFDSAGNLYCCGPGGVHIFDAEANRVGWIEIPEQTANFVWGDADLSSLYLTASTSLYRLRMRQPGYLPYSQSTDGLGE